MCNAVSRIARALLAPAVAAALVLSAAPAQARPAEDGRAHQAWCRVLEPSKRNNTTYDLMMAHNLAPYKGKPFAFVVFVSYETDSGGWVTVSRTVYAPTRHSIGVPLKLRRGHFISEVQGFCHGTLARTWNWSGR